MRYTLVVASLLMLSGSMSDVSGAAAFFQIGLLLFIAGLAPLQFGPHHRPADRVPRLAGLGASMLNPVALSIICQRFSQSERPGPCRGRLGRRGGFVAGDRPADWRRAHPDHRVALHLLDQSPHRRHRSGPGCKVRTGIESATGTSVRSDRAIPGFSLPASVTTAVIEGPHTGWSSWLILGLFATAAVALVIFLYYEPRRKEPLLDLRFFRSVPFSSATLLAVCSFASFAGFLFLNALYLQQARGYSALHTGLCTLPLAVMMIVSAPLSGKLVGMHGTLPSLLIAGAGFLLSTLILTGLTIATPLVLLLLVYALFGLGLGMVNPAITNNAVAGMPLSQAGVAAAIASTGRQVGAALGVAVAGTVVAASHAKGTDFTRATHPIWWNHERLRRAGSPARLGVEYALGPRQHRPGRPTSSKTHPDRCLPSVRQQRSNRDLRFAFVICSLSSNGLP